MSWAIELTQYDISYEPRLAIKAQVLADFLAEMTHPGRTIPGNGRHMSMAPQTLRDTVPG
jgi:hypothetical protein